MSKKKSDKPFDKYYYYTRSVQSPDADVEFLRNTYKELKGEEPKTLREDFCGTFANSCAWVKMGNQFEAFGVDLDPEPIAYGRKCYFDKLSDGQKGRVHISEGNVLDPKLPKADVVAATNFSYFIFKERSLLKKYFKNVYKRLKDDSIFVLDCFGGSQCYEALEEETDYGDFSYYWDLDEVDPVSNNVMYYIHFKLKGEKKNREKCFVYDWRMWSIAEIREILTEVGFSKVHVYWEGTTKDGEGDGNFTRVQKGEECEAWIAYIAAEK